MSDPKRNGKAAENENPKDTDVAETAGFVAFSGIAISMIAGTFGNRNRSRCCESPSPVQTPHVQSKAASCDKPSSSRRTIEIVKGDTLWGLSRKYGVSIDAIKKANGLKGDTIYAGKKLVIP